MVNLFKWMKWFLTINQLSKIWQYCTIMIAHMRTMAQCVTAHALTTRPVWISFFCREQKETFFMFFSIKLEWTGTEASEIQKKKRIINLIHYLLNILTSAQALLGIIAKSSDVWFMNDSFESDLFIESADVAWMICSLIQFLSILNNL